MVADRLIYGLPRTKLTLFLEKKPLYILAKLSLIMVIWLLLDIIVINTKHILAKICIWFVIGFFINGLIQLVHDAWHGNLFNRRWQNNIFGHAMSLLFPIMFEPAKHGHMLHHRYNRTEKDPDAYNAGKRSWHLVLLYYVVILIGLPLAIIHFNILYPLQYYSNSQLKKHFLLLALIILYYICVWSLIIHADLTKIALEGWVMPFLFTGPWNGFKSVADHYANEWKGNKFKTATTVRSNWFITYFWNGLNYHLEHHLFPGVPGYHLASIHQFTRKRLQQEQSPLFDSYLKVWWSAWRVGPIFVDDDIYFISIASKRSTS